MCEKVRGEFWGERCLLYQFGNNAKQFTIEGQGHKIFTSISLRNENGALTFYGSYISAESRCH